MSCESCVMRKFWGWRTPESAGLDGVNLSICLGEGAWLFLWGSIFTPVVSFAKFPEPYSGNPVYILEHKRLFCDIFGYYTPYQGCHGDEENQNNLNKVQILHGNNKGLHRLGNRMPNLENRWLLMDSVLGLENLCQYLGELFNCISTALHSELCGQKNIAGCRNVR